MMTDTVAPPRPARAPKHEALKRAIARVAYAAGDAGGDRPWLKGVLVEQLPGGAGRYAFVATDGHRLAYAEAAAEAGVLPYAHHAVINPRTRVLAAPTEAVAKSGTTWTNQYPINWRDSMPPTTGGVVVIVARTYLIEACRRVVADRETKHKYDHASWSYRLAAAKAAVDAATAAWRDVFSTSLNKSSDFKVEALRKVRVARENDLKTVRAEEPKLGPPQAKVVVDFGAGTMTLDGHQVETLVGFDRGAPHEARSSWDGVLGLDVTYLADAVSQFSDLDYVRIRVQDALTAIRVTEQGSPDFAVVMTSRLPAEPKAPKDSVE